MCLPFLKSDYKASKAELEETLGQIITRAAKDPNYIMIFIGFFSCGFQLAFVTAHFPALVTETCAAIDPDGVLASFGVTTTAALGAVAIGVIGIFNIIGTITAGALGNRFQKKPACLDLWRADNYRGLVYHHANNALYRSGIFRCYGLIVACNSAAHLRACGTSIWPALYGHALWSCILLTPARFFRWCLAGR